MTINKSIYGLLFAFLITSAILYLRQLPFENYPFLFSSLEIKIDMGRNLFNFFNKSYQLDD
jgi:hypothetical protein